MKPALMVTLGSYGVALILGGLLFWSSQDVQRKERELSRIQAGIEQEEEAIRVLQTEWALLTRPDRLEYLAATELNFVPVTVARVIHDPAEMEPVIGDDKTARANMVAAAIKPAPRQPEAPQAVADHAADFRKVLAQWSRGGDAQ